jgi:hypothetical protein
VGRAGSGDRPSNQSEEAIHKDSDKKHPRGTLPMVRLWNCRCPKMEFFPKG